VAFPQLVDTLLDRTIAPGYTRAGIALRRRLPGWTTALPRMDGRTVLVTGPTSGIGEAAATAYAQLGARVVLLARNVDKAATTQTRIARAVHDRDPARAAALRTVRCDVSSLASVRAAAAELIATEDRIDVLLHNAGAMPPERAHTDDGVELAFATNVVGPFLLTGLLQERLERSAPSRVITISSGGMYAQRLDVRDPQSLAGAYRPATVYARNKRAQVVLGELWAARLRGTGVVTHAMHPGWVDTPGVRESLPAFHRVTRSVLRSAAEGADTAVWLGAAEEPARSTGRFWMDRRPRPTHLTRRTRETAADRARLWELCGALSGLELPLPG
jgi:NAD(P)-dependent dehydrogenase (short-subunit alcohol dehydrogenase family)